MDSAQKEEAWLNFSESMVLFFKYILLDSLFDSIILKNDGLRRR